MKRSGPATAYKRKNFPKYARAANVIGAAYKAWKGRSKTGTKSASQRPGLQGITTFQHDVKNVYRYKRAPKSKRRKWKRSRKAFTHNLLKAEGSRKFHYHGSQTWATSAGTQNFYGWVNYGSNGTGGVDGTGDMGDLFIRLDQELRLKGTAAEAANGGYNSRRYYLDHMRSRVVLTNTGSSPIFWEIYECVCRTDIPVAEGNNLPGLYDFMQLTQNQASLTAGAGGDMNTSFKTSAVSLPSRTQPGVTPFQYRHWCQNWKILKVTRLQAAAGNSVSFDASDPRNLTVNWDNYVDLIAKKGVTKCYIVRQWGAVTAAAPNNSASSAQFEVEKDYNIKVLDKDLPQLNYITYTG